jgi:hypothetical protein
VLQDRIGKLIRMGGCCGMEMNVGETKVMRIAREAFQVKNYERIKIARKCGIF